MSSISTEKYTIHELLTKGLLTLQEALRLVKKEGLFSVFLLQCGEVIEELIENDKITKKDVSFLLDSIQYPHDLYNFSRYGKNLISYILTRELLTKELVQRYDSLIRQHKLFKKRNIRDIFELFRKKNVDNSDLLQQLELYRHMYVFDFNKRQKSWLRLKYIQSEKARNILKQIIANNLEHQYDFEEVKRLIEKDDGKKKYKMNF